MGIDPRRIQYLRLAAGDIAERMRSVRQIGESIQSVRTRFALISEFSDIRLL
jgi:hypothetical protein